MSGSDDRPKRSWREIDQMRSQGSTGDRNERRPRGPLAEARAKEATKAYLKDADKLFYSLKGEELGKAMRDAHGSPKLAETCRVYLEQVGMPRDPALLSLMVDSAERELMTAALDAMLQLAQAGQLSASSSLKTQLRPLCEHSDDNIAGAAEDLLDLL